MDHDWMIEIVSADGSTRTLRLDAGGLTIGRAPDNDVALPDGRVSAHHARLLWQQEVLVLTDLSSAHGTQVSSRRIHSTVIHPGDPIQIGPYLLRVQRGAPPVTARVPGSEASPPAEARGPARPSTGTHPAAAAGSAGGHDAPADSPAMEDGQEDRLDPAGLVGVMDLEVVLDSLLDRMMKLTEARRGYVVLASRNSLSPLIARQGRGFPSEESFSRTVCERALSLREPVLLSMNDLSEYGPIPSLMELKPEWVLSVPLIDGDVVLGVLYLESDSPLPVRLRKQFPSLARVSAVGGRALRAAIDRRQIVAEKERWRWLASLGGEARDIRQACQGPAMQAVVQLINRVAAEAVTAIIVGESGTGKEVAARSIHRLSAQSAGPFVAINCGAIPRDLMEAEIFGYDRGAFTGATEARPGRFELAQSGTLFLDEVGELPRDLQVKLLRVLEDRSFERLGSRAPILFDGRLLAATNRNLEVAVADGSFREDLYYRLNVVCISLPPLRERREDIEALATGILLQTNRRFRRRLCAITPEAMARLTAYDWPGNIRELRNVIERAFVLESTDRLTVDALPHVVPTARPIMPAVKGGRDTVLALSEFLERQERDYLRLVLDEFGGNVSKAATALRIDRSSLHKKMKHLGIAAGTGRDRFEGQGA